MWLQINLRPAVLLNTACGFREWQENSVFHLPYLPSFAQPLRQFQPWFMQGQVTRSGRDPTKQISNRAITTMFKRKL